MKGFCTLNRDHSRQSMTLTQLSANSVEFQSFDVTITTKFRGAKRALNRFEGVSKPFLDGFHGSLGAKWAVLSRSSVESPSLPLSLHQIQRLASQLAPYWTEYPLKSCTPLQGMELYLGSILYCR